MGRLQRTTAAKRQEHNDSDENTQANDQSSADSMSPPPRQGDTPAATESVDQAQTEDPEESDPDIEISNLPQTAAGSENATAVTNAPNTGKGASSSSKSKGKGKAPKG